MKYALLLPFLASAASAQDDLWKTLAKGDRIQVTFRSGNTILGNLTSKPADPRIQATAVDYSSASEITLDVSLEYPGLNGTMTIPKKEIKEIRKLQNMDPATMKRIQEEMARIQKQAAVDEATRKANESERDKIAKKKIEEKEKEDAEKKDDKEAGEKALKAFQDLQNGKDLLKRFPPGEQWGPQTASQVAEKTLRKQPVSQDEIEFLKPETQRLWTIALNSAKEAAEKKEKEKAAEKKQ